jgi:hypothetical protein
MFENQNRHVFSQYLELYNRCPLQPCATIGVTTVFSAHLLIGGVEHTAKVIKKYETTS